jgi:hypothetical protein
MQFMESVDANKAVLGNGSFNILHPLIKWYLNNAELIMKDFAYYGYQLFNELQGEAAPQFRVVAVNEILERLRVLLPPNATPSPELNIAEKDLLNKTSATSLEPT